jgi:four helix bundle protein
MNQEPRGTIKNFTDLRAWQEGHKLVLFVYQLTKKFPKDELFALTSQLRRASISITSNIAEGFSRHSYKEKVNFYHISLGSTTEVENQLILSRDIHYISEEEFRMAQDLLITVNKLCNGLIKKSKEFYS